MLFRSLLMGLLAWMNALPGGMDTHRLTVFFTVFVMLQFWNLFNAGVFGTDHSVFRDASRAKGLLWTALLILAGQIIIVTFGGEVFRTEPLPLHEWLLITAGTSLVLWAGEAWRAVARARHRKQTARESLSATGTAGSYSPGAFGSSAKTPYICRPFRENGRTTTIVNLTHSNKCL